MKIYGLLVFSISVIFQFVFMLSVSGSPAYAFIAGGFTTFAGMGGIFIYKATVITKLTQARADIIPGMKEFPPHPHTQGLYEAYNRSLTIAEGRDT